MSDQDIACMRLALEEAKKAAERDEVPVGAVIVNSETGDVVAANGNRTRELKDPTAHAEILVIREACQKMGAQRIPELTLYVTLEPCTQCTAAISFARIKRLVYGAEDKKGGAVLSGVRFFEQPTCHHRPEFAHGVLARDSAKILRDFFKSKR